MITELVSYVKYIDCDPVTTDPSVLRHKKRALSCAGDKEKKEMS